MLRAPCPAIDTSDEARRAAQDEEDRLLDDHTYRMEIMDRLLSYAPAGTPADRAAAFSDAQRAA